MEIDNCDASLETLLKDFPDLNKDDPLVSTNCKKIEQGIKNGNFTILQLVEHLGTLLIHFAPAKRELGVEILTQVLEKLDESHLSSEQLRFIATFYSDRVNDHHQVIPPVIRGILALIKFNNFPDGCATQILNSLFSNIPCQQQQCTERHNIYSIFQILLDRKSDELRNMGLDFVYGVISAMDSERDPRNLLLLFNWLPKFLKTVTLAHLNEEMFETIACYFPVDFRAPPQESNAITRDMLAESLCPCLCAVPSFAQFCLPLALEKLDSSLRIAKLDSLQLLKEGCKTFSIESYQEHSVQIWAQLYKELLQTTNDPEIEFACLDTLSKYIAKLSAGEENPFRRHLKDIIDTVKRNLLPEEKFFEITSKILLHITQASQPAAHFTAKEILPILMNTYSITKTSAHQIKVLKVMVGFARILNDFFNGNDINVEELEQIPVLVVAALTQGDSEMKITAWNSISVIALSDNLKNCVFENMREDIARNLDERLREALLCCFKTLAIKYPDEIESEIIKKVELQESVALRLFLDALSRICAHKQFVKVVFPVLMRYCLGTVEQAEIAFACLSGILEKQETNCDITNYLIENLDAIKQTIKWVEQNNEIAEKSSLLDNISVCLKILVGSLKRQQQEDLLTSEVNHIVQNYKEGANPVHIVLLSGLLLRMHQDISIASEIIDTIFAIAFEPNSVYSNEVSIELLANILNKIKNEEELCTYLERISSKCNAEINRVNIKVVSWIAKALLMRNHQQTNMWIEKVLEMVEKNEEANTSLKIIMSDRSDALSMKSCCQIQLLYRQKFFMEISNKLQDLHPNISNNLLVAFGYLLQETPHAILLTAVEKVLKPIFLCIDNCTSPEALCSICETLLKLIEETHPLAEEHISDLLPRFLKLAGFKPSMKVRMAALRCLKAFTSGYPVYKLLPHKQTVVYELAAALDDSKRLVRKEAVEARSRWFLVDAPI